MDKKLSLEIKKEIAKLEKKDLFSEKFKKKKLLTYTIRTSIAITLYIIFWSYQWIKWSLLIYIPLNLFSLFSIFGWKFLINRKIQRLKNKIN